MAENGFVDSLSFRRRQHPRSVIKQAPPSRSVVVFKPTAPRPRPKMIDVIRQKTADQRSFVHKRLFRAATGFVTGGPGAAVGGFFAPTTPQPPPVRRPAPRSTTARPSVISAAEKEGGKQVKFPMRAFAPITKCKWPQKWDPNKGQCVFAIGIPGTDDPVERALVGDAVMGQYGAGLEPGSRIVDRAICLRGMVLGNDGICYNKSQVRNADRMWPRGRRPLLTGGDMRAISTAARAGRRLEGATKRLQKIGLMKKPPPQAEGRKRPH